MHEVHPERELLALFVHTHWASLRHSQAEEKWQRLAQGYISATWLDVSVQQKLASLSSLHPKLPPVRNMS